MKTGTSHLVIFAALILSAAMPGGPVLGMSGTLSPSLDSLSGSSADSNVAVVIFLEQKSKGQIQSAVASLPDQTRATRIKSVLRALSSGSAMDRSAAVENFLAGRAIGDVRRFWIAPAVEAVVPVSSLAELASLPGVVRVVPNVALDFDEPMEVKPAPSATTSVANELSLLKVPELWQMGFRGAGRLICSFDTGVESTHPALASKWRGAHAKLSSSWFSKVAPDTIPYDKSGHGTHTMGVMVGSTATDSFGVAPAAEWITAGVIDQGRPLNVTIADIIEAFQWALNPDGDTATTDDVPDVILNSWGIPTGLFEPCDQTFTTVIDNVETAGIVTIFACGNEGPNAMTIRNPADMASTPINSFSVGAIDLTRTIANFSSRGPSSCDTTQIKPELVAPGVSIRSSTRGGTYAYMSGTSMAAPYIAGLVALCREYNPDATVAQIKYALLQAAVDLGPTGEDNAYGHGLVDASRLLQYLPSSSAVRFSLLGRVISGDGVANPGEAVDLQLLVGKIGSIEKATGSLASLVPGQVLITKSSAQFLFGSGGSTALNADPFSLRIDSSLVNGAEIPLVVTFRDSASAVLDSFSLTLIAGYPAPGRTLALSTSKIKMSVSDFAQYGLAAGSIYNLAGQGFRVNGSHNLLYEAGLIVGRNSLQLASSVRDSLGCFCPSAFAPTESLSETLNAADGGIRTTCQFSDTRSAISIPVTISQTTDHFQTTEDAGYVIITYQLVNQSLQTLTGIQFGLMTDFDLSDEYDQTALNSELRLAYQRGDGTQVVGLAALTDGARFRALDNGSGKRGLSGVEKYNLVSAAGDSVDASAIGDRIMLVSFGPFTIGVGDSVAVSIAMIGGESVSDVAASATRAMQRMGIPTGIDNPEVLVPESFTLDQNYPNPFNPSTTIAFTLPAAADVQLDVFNLLGERVRTLASGTLAAGVHEIEWNGTNDRGDAVASGVYFYRLSSAEETQTRKMLLAK